MGGERGERDRERERETEKDRERDWPGTAFSLVLVLCVPPENPRKGDSAEGWEIPGLLTL